MVSTVIEGAAKLAPYNPSSPSVIDSCWRLAKINSFDVVYDLGCGDGRVISHIAVMCKCKCVGIEYDKVFYERAKENVSSNPKISSLVELRYGDACKVEDLNRATVIFCYLSVKGNKEFEERVKVAYKNGCRIVSNMFKLDFLGENEKPRDFVVCDRITKLYLYKSKEFEMEHMLPFIELMDGYLDPLKNPKLLPIFNFAILSLVIVLFVLFIKGVRNVHVFAMGGLAVCLLLSVNYFVAVLEETMEEQEKEQKLSLNLGKDSAVLKKIQKKHLKQSKLMAYDHSDNDSSDFEDEAETINNKKDN